MLHRLLDPLVHRRAEALRDHAADDLVHELVPLVALERLEDDRAVAELAAAAGLLLVARVGARLLADRLEVRDARLVQLDLGAEAALDPLDGDLDVHLREAGEQLLARLVVAAQDERRILLDEPAQRGHDLVLVALRLRRDREAHDRLAGSRATAARPACPRERSRSAVVVSLSFATAPMSPAAKPSTDVVVLALEEQQLAEALLAVRAPVHEHRVALRSRPMSTRKIVMRPGERVGERLEHERRGADVGRLDRERLLRRGRDALDDQVEHARSSRGSSSPSRRRPGRSRRARPRSSGRRPAPRRRSPRPRGSAP